MQNNFTLSFQVRLEERRDFSESEQEKWRRDCFQQFGLWADEFQEREIHKKQFVIGSDVYYNYSFPGSALKVQYRFRLRFYAK